MVARRVYQSVVRLVGQMLSAAINSRLPLHRLIALLSQAEKVGIVDVRGTRFAAYVTDDSAYLGVKQWAQTEPETLDWIDAMPEGAVLLDVGGNIGRFSLYAAARGVTVVVIEPDGRACHQLSRNAMLNGLPLRILHIAAADRDGFGLLGFDHVQQAELGRRGGFGYEVAVRRIDSLVAEGVIAQPTHIKIDVDGLETAVLGGCKNTLQSVSSVAVEVAAENEQDVAAMLAEFDESRREVIGGYGANVQFARSLGAPRQP